MSAKPAAAQEERAALGRVKFVAGLSPGEFEEFWKSAQRRCFTAGAVLFLEGEACEGMYLIVAGAVRIFKMSSAGREIELALQEAPASIAEVPVFDGGPYPASARAVGDVVAYHVSKSAFAELIRSNPEVGLKMLAVAGERLRALVQLVHRITFGGVRQRLAQLLLDQERLQQASPFELKLTHRQLADSLGTVREVVSRNLSRFENAGLIRHEGRRFWIEDRAGLEAEAAAELH